MYAIKACFQLARPHQHVKNIFILLPLFFAHKMGDVQAWTHTLYAFLAFSLAASGVYGFNDILDIEADRAHPVKKNRPLASGALKVSTAVISSLALLLLAVAISFAVLSGRFLMIGAVYLLLNIGYSFFLKHIAILDVACIALGFVLRVLAGATAADVPVSHWIVIMTFLLAILLALGKRRDDLVLAASGCSARKSLNGYSLEFVSQGMGIMASVVIVAYILYCVSPEVVERQGSRNLYLTAFWVVIGLLRYLQAAFVQGKSGSPTIVLLKDHFLQATIAGWILTFYGLTYGFGG
jgi:4-hydroxybenzoate polyprenyltransferase